MLLAMGAKLWWTHITFTVLTKLHLTQATKRPVWVSEPRKNPSNTSLLLPGQLRPPLPACSLDEVLPTFPLVHSATKSTASTTAPSCALNLCDHFFREIQMPSLLWFQPTLNFLSLLRILSCYNSILGGADQLRTLPLQAAHLFICTRSPPQQ